MLRLANSVVILGGLFTMVLIVLKLTSQLAWGWMWTLSPTWIPLLILAAMLLHDALVINR
jgi:sterol desaturase/sphingolipid hydroxylase (fatty acid hydroxylase superfamily)